MGGLCAVCWIIVKVNLTFSWRLYDVNTLRDVLYAVFEAWKMYLPTDFQDSIVWDFVVVTASMVHFPVINNTMKSKTMIVVRFITGCVKSRAGTTA